MVTFRKGLIMLVLTRIAEVVVALIVVTVTGTIIEKTRRGYRKRKANKKTVPVTAA